MPGGAAGGRAAERAEELARLAGFTRLRALGVPEEDLPELAATAAGRTGSARESAPGSPAEVLALLPSVFSRRGISS